VRRRIARNNRFREAVGVPGARNESGCDATRPALRLLEGSLRLSAGRTDGVTGTRRANHFVLSEVMSSPPAANTLLPLFRNIWLSSCVPRPIKRGVSRSSRTLGGGCDGRGGARDERAGHGRTSRVVLAPRCWRQASRAIGLRRGLSSRHPGESAEQPLTPLRGGCRLYRLPCRCLRAQVHFLCTQGPRVRPASGIPCALCLSRGTRTMQHPDGSRRGKVEPCVPELFHVTQITEPLGQRLILQ
jgi:hypothetical protein